MTTDPRNCPFADWPDASASAAEDHALFHRLVDLRAGLKSLPRFMKLELAQWVIGRPTVFIRQFNEARLGLLRISVEPLADAPEGGGHADYADLCRELATARGPRSVADRLGVDIDDDYFFYTWEQWAGHAQARGDHAAAVYCLANAWVQLPFRPDVPGGGAWRDAWGDWVAQGFRPDARYSEPVGLLSASADRLIRLAAALEEAGRPDLAVAAFEAWLGLPGMTADGQVEVLGRALRRSPLAMLPELILPARVLLRLAHALRAAGRGRGAAEALIVAGRPWLGVSTA